MILYDDGNGKRIVKWRGKLHVCIRVYEDDEKEAWALADRIIWRAK